MTTNSLAHHLKNKVLLFITISLLLTILLGTHFLPVILQVKSNKLDLRGDWEICIPHHFDGPTPSQQTLDDCYWTTAKAPQEINVSQITHFQGWIIYRKNFTTPDWCISEPDSCTFLSGAVSDSLEVLINNTVIGKHGKFPPNTGYTTLSPIRFFIPQNILKTTDAYNTIHLVTFTERKTLAGLINEPLGIYYYIDSFYIDYATNGAKVLLAIISTIGILTLTLISIIARLYETQPNRLFDSYIEFTFASALITLSMSRIIREFVTLKLGYDLHFMIRVYFDLISAQFICNFFNFKSRTIKILQTPFYISLFTLFIITILDIFKIEPTKNFGGFDTVFPFVAAIVPLLLVPPLLGLYGSIRGSSKIPLNAKFRKIFIILFTCVFLMQLSDFTLFWRLHFLWIPFTEIYFIRIYPFFVALTFGYIIFKEKLKVRQNLEIAASVGTIATQVAHDIRSPLSALATATADITHLSRDQHLVIQNSINRIQHIANDLLTRYQASASNHIQTAQTTQIKTQPLLPLIESLINEKRLQYSKYSSISIHFEAPSSYSTLSSNVDASEFQRILSNLINNAVEALPHQSGSITLTLTSSPHSAIIQIADNGKGIPPHILSQLQNNTALSFEKTNGHGLGLAHARQHLSSWGGSLHIESTLQQGTKITLTLPITEIPATSTSPNAVLIDDDPLVHSMWQIIARKHNKSLLCYLNIASFLSAADSINTNTPIYIDSNLGHAESGETLAKIIFEKGFTTIHLTTGHPPDHFPKNMHWITSIIGKKPPWD